MITVLGAILDVAGPRASFLERVPQILERLHRHVGMAHDVVRLSHQFALAETTDVQEIPVHISNQTLEIGLGHDQRGIGQHDLVLGHGQIASHILGSSRGAGLLSVLGGVNQCHLMGQHQSLDVDHDEHPLAKRTQTVDVLGIDRRGKLRGGPYLILP